MSNFNEYPSAVNQEGVDGVRRRQMSYDDLKVYALTMMGFPNVDVEADESQFQVIFEACFDEYNKWLPLWKLGVIEGVSPTISKYNLKELGKPFGRGVVKVDIVTHAQFFSPIAGILGLGVPHPITHISPDQFVLSNMYVRTAEEVYSASPEWVWEEPILWMHSPTAFGGAYSVAYTYSQDHSSAEDIPQEDHSWFKKYFLANVKIAVYEARAKFGSVPGPSKQTLRGDRALDRALDDKEKLEASIQSKSSARTPPLWLGR